MKDNVQTGPKLGMEDNGASWSEPGVLTCRNHFKFTNNQAT